MGEKIDLDKKKLSIAIVLFISLIILFSPLKEIVEDLVGFKEKELELIGNLNLDFNESVNIRPYEERIIVSKDDTITSYSYDNVKLWKKQLEKRSDIYLGKTSIFINNKDDKNISMLDLSGNEVWSYDLKYEAYTMTEIEDHLLVYLKIDKDNRAVIVLDKDGNLIMNNEKSKEEILSSNISKNKKNIVITSMDNSSQELNSKITYLKYNGDVIWTDDVSGKMIYNVLFLEKDKLLLIGDNEIICKNELSENIWKKEISYDLKDVNVLNDEIYILYGAGNSTLEILNSDGEIKHKKNFKVEYDDIDNQEDSIFLTGKDGVIELRNTKVSMKHDIKEKVMDVKKIENYMIISKEKNIDFFKIVEKKSN